MSIILNFNLLSAFIANTSIRGVSGTGSSGIVSLCMSIAAIGLLMAAIAVVKKLAKGEPKAMESLVGWCVALLAYFAIWKLI